jgi:VanZ family protein
MNKHRSAAVPLSLLVAALVVYASLYPFEGWRWPSGAWWSFLTAPWPRYWTGFDVTFNLLGYLPLGFLVCFAAVRSGAGQASGWQLAVVAGSGLSMLLELLQNLLPNRVPSNVDWALNTAGTALGATLAVAVFRMGGAARWQSWRERWFLDRSSGGLTLLLLWPLALLFPLPVPLGVGQVADRLHQVVTNWVAGTPAASWWASWFAHEALATPLLPATEFGVVMLGQLLPCLVLYAVSHPGWRRVVLAWGALVLGLATTTLSTALNFGPEHALTWLTQLTLTACGVGTLLAVLLAWISSRAAAALGLIAATALVVWVNRAPPDPYFAQSLAAWEQGRFVQFHGAAQWVGWLWPYAAMLHLWVMTVARFKR